MCNVSGNGPIRPKTEILFLRLRASSVVVRISLALVFLGVRLVRFLFERGLIRDDRIGAAGLMPGAITLPIIFIWTRCRQFFQSLQLILGDRDHLRVDGFIVERSAAFRLNQGEGRTVAHHWASEEHHRCIIEQIGWLHISAETHFHFSIANIAVRNHSDSILARGCPDPLQPLY